MSLQTHAQQQIQWTRARAAQRYGQHVAAAQRTVTDSATRFRVNRIALPSSALLATFICVLTSTAFALYTPALQHWYLIPVTLCGVLVTTDAIDWIRRKYDLYDPVGLIGVFSVHFFYLAPILHVQWGLFLDYTMDVTPPPDWRDWLGFMAVLNLAGLLAYRFCRNLFNRRNGVETKSYWTLDMHKLRLIAPAALLITGITQFAVYAKFGGIMGYIAARSSYIGGKATFTGMGWMFMISDSFPLIAALLGVTYLRKSNASWMKIVAGLCVMFVLCIIFGGLRGSRSNTIISLLWVAGAIHFLVRQVPRKLVALGVGFLLLFMYIYAFYKSGGLHALAGSQAREAIAQQHGRTFRGMLLGDLGRSDLHAYMVYKLVTDPSVYSYPLGRTYLGGLSVLIPHSMLPERPESTVKEGTELQRGPATYVPDVAKSSKVYGLAGEAMMNFGILAVPVAYALFGIVVGWFRSAVYRLSPGDIRLFFAPLGVYVSIAAIGSDSNNMTFAVVKFGAMPALIALLCLKRMRQHRWSKQPVRTGPVPA